MFVPSPHSSPTVAFSQHYSLAHDGIVAALDPSPHFPPTVAFLLFCCLSRWHLVLRRVSSPRSLFATLAFSNMHGVIAAAFDPSRHFSPAVALLLFQTRRHHYSIRSLAAFLAHDRFLTALAFPNTVASLQLRGYLVNISSFADPEEKPAEVGVLGSCPEYLV